MCLVADQQRDRRPASRRAQDPRRRSRPLPRCAGPPSLAAAAPSPAGGTAGSRIASRRQIESLSAPRGRQIPVSQRPHSQAQLRSARSPLHCRDLARPTARRYRRRRRDRHRESSPPPPDRADARYRQCGAGPPDSPPSPGRPPRPPQGRPRHHLRCGIPRAPRRRRPARRRADGVPRPASAPPHDGAVHRGAWQPRSRADYAPT